MQPSDKELVSVDQLPEDPLRMPPPYWRGSGAIFHILNALSDLESLLEELIPLNTATTVRLDAHYDKYPDESSESEKALDEFADIRDSLWQLEQKIRMKSEIACLMSAIQAEENLNQFCVFNIHRNIAESIEKLSPQEKLLVASSVLGHHDVKGTAPFESMQKLVKWRNAFVHGHCADRPTTSLRHNHLISPPEYPGVKSGLNDTIQMVEALLRIEAFLCSISLNPYTASSSVEFREMERSVEKLSKYRIDGNESAYEVTFDAVRT